MLPMMTMTIDDYLFHHRQKSNSFQFFPVVKKSSIRALTAWGASCWTQWLTCKQDTIVMTTTTSVDDNNNNDNIDNHDNNDNNDNNYSNDIDEEILTPSSSSSLKSFTKLAESSAAFTVRYLSRLPKISRVRACTVFTCICLHLLAETFKKRMQRKIIRFHWNLPLHRFHCVWLVAGLGFHFYCLSNRGLKDQQNLSLWWESCLKFNTESWVFSGQKRNLAKSAEFQGFSETRIRGVEVTI